MADGRFVSRSISTNEQLAGVSILADYLFQRCIPHLDVEGRLTGNPLLIKANVVPLRTEITAENIPALLTELAAATDHEGKPLVTWYEINGLKVLQFPGFGGQQKGLRKEREAASRLPVFSDAADLLPNSRSTPMPLPPSPRSSSGVGPAEVKVSEVKISEVKNPASDDAVGPASSAVVAPEKGTEQPEALPPKRDRGETWMTPFADAWCDRYGGDMPIKPAVRPLRALVDEHGADETLRRWTIYLAATEGAYANAARFASTWGEWNHEPAKRDRDPRNPFSGPLEVVDGVMSPALEWETRPDHLKFPSRKAG